MNTEELPSLSRPLRVADLDDEPRHEEIEVDADDRARIAKVYGIEDIALMRGNLDVIRSGTLVRVAGLLEADLGRICVVSLEPMREVISDHFAVEYTTEPPPPLEGEREADLDAPEPIEGETLDLGQVLLEQLVLSMDPHPRRDDAVAPEDVGRPLETSPFDVLKGLKS